MQAASNYFNLNLLLNHLTEFGTLYSFGLLLMGVREHICVWCPALTNGAPQMVEGNPYSVSIMYLYKDKQYTVFFFACSFNERPQIFIFPFPCPKYSFVPLLVLLLCSRSAVW